MNSEEIADVRRSIRGDREAFGRLIDRYASSVCGFQHRLVGDFHQAQDLAQETFLRAFCSLDRIDRPDRFRPWLFRIAFHVATDFRRSRRREPVSLDAIEEELGETFAASGGGSKAGEEQFDRERAALQAVGELPESYGLVVILRYVERLSYREIAEALETSVTCIKVRLHRARHMLRRKLAACEEPSG